MSQHASPLLTSGLLSSTSTSSHRNSSSVNGSGDVNIDVPPSPIAYQNNQSHSQGQSGSYLQSPGMSVGGGGSQMQRKLSKPGDGSLYAPKPATLWDREPVWMCVA